MSGFFVLYSALSLISPYISQFYKAVIIVYLLFFSKLNVFDKAVKTIGAHMKKILTGLALSLSAMMATSAMAAPHQDARYHNGKPTPPPAHWNAKDAKHFKDDRRVDPRKQNFGQVNPSRQWRSGDKLPRQFESNRYRLSSHESRHLPKAKSSQSWYKINGDYVLVNERNNKIVRIIG